MRRAILLASRFSCYTALKPQQTNQGAARAVVALTLDHNDRRSIRRQIHSSAKQESGLLLGNYVVMYFHQFNGYGIFTFISDKAAWLSWVLA